MFAVKAISAYWVLMERKTNVSLAVIVLTIYNVNV